LNGQNIAMIPVVDDDGVSSGVVVPVSVDNINSKTNSRYFVDVDYDINGRSRIISADGFTVELRPYYGNDAPTLMPEWNVIEFGIADVGDNNVNTWAFLTGNSFMCVEAREAWRQGKRMVERLR